MDLAAESRECLPVVRGVRCLRACAFRGYGKRQQLFKTGKRGARRPLSDSEKGDLALKAAGSSEGTQREKAAASQELSAPPEPKGLYKKDEDLLQAIHSAVESPPTEGAGSLPGL